jgi:TPR repeat protein
MNPLIDADLNALTDTNASLESRVAAYVSLSRIVDEASSDEGPTAADAARILRRLVKHGRDFGFEDRAGTAYEQLVARYVTGCPFAAFRLGLVLRDGSGVDRDVARSVECLQFAIERKVPTARYALAQLYRGNSTLDPHGTLETKMLTEAHMEGDGEASWRLFRRLEDKDYEAAVKVLEAQATFALPSLPGLVTLGNERARNGEADTAMALYERAIDLADASEYAAYAHLCAGRLLIQQAGAQPDVARAELALKAREHLDAVPEGRHEFAAARSWLGHFAMHLSTPQDIASAIQHYEAAASRSYLPAMRELARIYESRDQAAEAKLWSGRYEEACAAYKPDESLMRRLMRSDPAARVDFRRHCQNLLDDGDCDGALLEIERVFELARRGRHGENSFVLRDAAILGCAAEANLRLGRVDEAALLYRRALDAKQTPKNRGICLQGLVSCLRHENKFEEAIVLLKQELHTNKHAGLVMELASALDATGRTDEGVRLFEDMLWPGCESAIREDAPAKSRNAYARMVWKVENTASTNKRVKFAVNVLLRSMREAANGRIDVESLRTLGAGAAFAPVRRTLRELLTWGGTDRDAPRFMAEQFGSWIRKRNDVVQGITAVLEGMASARAFHADLVDAVTVRIRNEAGLLRDYPALGQALARIAWRTLAHFYYHDKDQFWRVSEKVFSVLLENDVEANRDDWLFELFTADRHYMEQALVRLYSDAVQGAIDPLLRHCRSSQRTAQRMAIGLAEVIHAAPAVVLKPAAYGDLDTDSLTFSVERLCSMVNTRLYNLAQKYGKSASAQHSPTDVLRGGGITSVHRARVTHYVIEHVLHPAHGSLASLARSASAWRAWIAVAGESIRIQIDFRGVDVSDADYKAARRVLATRCDRAIISDQRLTWNANVKFARVCLDIPVNSRPVPVPELSRYLRGLKTELHRLRQARTANPAFYIVARSAFPGAAAFARLPRDVQVDKWRTALQAVCDVFHGYFLECHTSGSDEGRSPIALVHDLKSRVAALAAADQTTVDMAIRDVQMAAARFDRFASAALRIDPDLQQLDVTACVKRFVEGDRALAGTVFVEGEAQCVVRTRRSIFEPAMRELVSNGVTASPPSARVVVTIARETDDVKLIIANMALDQPSVAGGERTGRGLRAAERSLSLIGARVSVDRRDGQCRTLITLPLQ